MGTGVSTRRGRGEAVQILLVAAFGFNDKFHAGRLWASKEQQQLAARISMRVFRKCAWRDAAGRGFFPLPLARGSPYSQRSNSSRKGILQRSTHASGMARRLPRLRAAKQSCGTVLNLTHIEPSKRKRSARN